MSKYHTEKIEGIVVKTFASGDCDLVLKAICSPGSKMSLFAKHVRQGKRRFGFGLELFDHGFFEISRHTGSLVNVRNFSSVHSFGGIRSDLNKLTAATLLAESFEALVHEEEGPGTWPLSLLLAGLQGIESSQQAQTILRSTYLCLSHLLIRAGFKDSSSIGTPSSKKLTSIIDEIEFYSERQLMCKRMMQDLIEETKHMILNAQKVLAANV